MPLISGIEKFYAREGYVTIFGRFFCLTAPKNFVGEPFCAVFPVAKKFIGGGKEGVSRFSVENFLSHSAEKFCRGTFSVSLISGIEKFYA